MAIVECKECKQKVAQKATICPYCGIKRPGFNLEEPPLVAKLVFFFLVLAIAAAFFIDDSIEGSGQDVAKQELSKEKDRSECLQDLMCTGELYSLTSKLGCPPEIEKLASYDYEWIDGFVSSKFSHYRWEDEESGVITYIGDKLKVQNAFGAWQNIVYECDIDTKSEAVINVRAKVGRL